MNIWEDKRWKIRYKDYDGRTGLRLRVNKGVDREVERACREFCKWLRKNYDFPISVSIYLEMACRIDKDKCDGRFYLTDDDFIESYIRIATGVYDKGKSKIGKDRILKYILGIIAHELTHYYHWINMLEEQSKMISESQAN